MPRNWKNSQELSGDKDAVADALATAHEEELARVEAKSLRERMQLTARPWRH